MSSAYIQVHFRPDFFMEANNMNPDQTAPWEQSDLGSYCLQYMLPKNISRREEQKTSRDWWAKGLSVFSIVPDKHVLLLKQILLTRMETKQSDQNIHGWLLSHLTS